MSRELTRQEKAAIRSLVKRWCANYDKDAGCLPLDCECYMLGKCWTGAYCRYFRSAVLPLDPVLERSLTVETVAETRPCPVCGRAFLPDGRQRYCSPACAGAARRQKQRGYMRKYRGTGTPIRFQRYLLIDWVPNATIRELTDNANSTIAALPQELREDVIVMEITFENGKTLTKAITVSLLEDGTFFAKFDNYEITAEDDFVKRPDSKSILREILYAQGSGTALSEEYPLDDAPVLEGDYKNADPTEPETIIVPGEITFTGTIVDHTIESLAYIILVDVDENSGLTYDKVLFELTDNQKMWESKIGARVQIVCSDTFQESRPPIGDLISIEEVDGTVTNNSLDTAKMTAQDYYTNSVFEVVSMELKSQTAEEISFSVCVSKGGVIQEPNRTIFLQLINDAWEVVNEGY